VIALHESGHLLGADLVAAFRRDKLSDVGARDDGLSGGAVVSQAEQRRPLSALCVPPNGLQLAISPAHWASKA